MINTIRPKSILIVEDDEADFFLLRKGFLRAGYRGVLEHAFTTDLAYRSLVGFLESEEGLPDLIILDLGLPGESGLEMIKKLKSEPVLREISIVVVSGSESTRDMSAARDLGADWFFRKCDTSDEMNYVVQTILSFGWLPSPLAVAEAATVNSDGYLPAPD